MINYEIRNEPGERIEFVVPPAPVTDNFDFLVFDGHTALIHDYGPDPLGHQVGGEPTMRPDHWRAGRTGDRAARPRPAVAGHRRVDARALTGIETAAAVSSRPGTL